MAGLSFVISDSAGARRRKPRTVTIVDIGLSPSFDSSTAVIQSSLRSLNEGGEEGTVAVDVIRTRDRPTVLSAMTAPTTVLHVIAHNDWDGDGPGFISGDGSVVVSLAHLRAHVETSGRPVTASAVFLDGCRTFTKVWQEEFARCLDSETAYIGSRVDVGWHDALVFAPAFYGSLFRSAGRGLSKVERACDAAGRAEKAFEALTDRPSPYRSTRLGSTQ